LRLELIDDKTCTKNKTERKDMETLLAAKPVSQKAGSKSRIAYMDQIKVFLTCLVVAHHAAQAYGPTGGVWVVNDGAKAVWLRHLFFINASFMMGLYFFISGYFMVFSIGRKSHSTFINDRMKRLGIPLLIFTFLVFLPFNYLGADTDKNLAAFFLDTYWNKPPIATGHLWFVASLLLYTFIYLVLFRRITQPSKPIRKSFKAWYIPAYIIALSILSGLVRLQYPIDVWRTWIIPVEVAHIPQYFSLFIIGALFNRHGWLAGLKLKTCVFYLLLACAAYCINAALPLKIRNYWVTKSTVESLLCVGISMGILGIFRRFGNKTNAVTRLLSSNAYGIYLFHLFIVIAFQQWLVGWQLLPTMKFILVTGFSIVTSLIVSAILRRNRIISKII
jgi:fucose 4-O-acetylase-like acetyltransferase